MEKTTYRVRRWFSRLLASGLVVILLLISLAGYTTFGLNMALRLVNFSVPNMINYTGLSGTLATGAHVDQMTIRYANQTATFNHLTFELRLLELLHGHIQLDQVHADAIYAPRYPTLTLTDIVANINLASDAVRVDAQYKLPHYHFSQHLKLRGTLGQYTLALDNFIGKQTFTLTGSGTAESIQVKGKDAIDIQLSANWQQALQLSLQLHGSLHIPQLQTDIDIDPLAIAVDGPNIDMRIPGIEGTWQGKPLVIKGEGHIQDNQYRGNIQLEYEKNTLQAKGTLGKMLSAEGVTHILHLADFIPDIEGTVTLKARASGDPTRPNIHLDYTLTDLIYQTNHIEKAYGTLQVNPKQVIDANLVIQKALIGQRDVKQASATLTGSMEGHRLSITLQEPSSTITTVLEGSYHDATWKGLINTLTITTPKSTVQLAQPATISYTDKGISYQDFCLQDKYGASLCAHGQANLTTLQWNNTIDLQSFALESLGDIPVAASAIIKGGTLQGSATFQGKGSTIITQTGHITLQNGLVYLAEQNMELWLQKGRVHINDDGFAIEVDSQRQDHHFHIHASCKHVRCEGIIQGENILLSKTKMLHIVADPDLRFTLQDARLFLQGEVKIHDSAIIIQTHSNALTLPSDVHIIKPDTKTTTSSAISLDPRSHLTLHLDKAIKVGIGNTTGKLAGELHMTFPEDTPPICSGKIQLIDGKYKGYGQNLKIHTGDISYSNSPIDNPDIDIIAVREVPLNDETSSLRNLEEDKVGIRITGTAENPNINLFSYPDQLPEDEILSLLITGQKSAFSDGGVSSSSLSPFMLGSYLLETTGTLSGIGKMLSLDTVHIFDSSTTPGNGTPDVTMKTKDGSMKILVTKHINKRFSINGNFNIYSSEYQVSAQYKLSRHFSIKTYVTDFSQGVSLLYKFESNN